MRRILVGAGLALVVASPALADGGRCAAEGATTRAAAKTLRVEEHQLPGYRELAAYAPRWLAIRERFVARDEHYLGRLDAQIAQTSLSARKACDRPLGPGSERCLAKQAHLAALQALRVAEVSKLANDEVVRDAAAADVPVTRQALLDAEGRVDADRAALDVAAAAFRDCKATK